MYRLLLKITHTLLAWLFLVLLAACHDNSSSHATASANPALENPYGAGTLSTLQLAIEADDYGQDKPLLVFAPDTGGAYPIIQFQHGFSASNADYSDLLHHIASHGFVVVAPQMYPGGNPNDAPGIAEEVEAAKALLDWAGAQLNQVLADNAPAGADLSADQNNIGIAGHSRGGQVAWRVTTEHPGSVMALAGVDPVDGDAPPWQVNDPGPLVTAEDAQFPFAIYLLGTGLGAQGEVLACAPENRNHEHFYTASSAPAYHVVANDYGHNDMLNEDSYAQYACASNYGGDYEAMRRFTAGQLVAYFSATLKGSSGFEFLSDISQAPVSATAENK